MATKNLFFTTIIGFLFAAPLISAVELEDVFNWKTVDYNWDANYWTKEFAEKNGLYIPDHNLPVGLEVWKNKMFITVPRLKKGVPSTLNYIELNSTTKDPKLTPYPDWPTNEIYFFNHISARNQFISVIRVRVDACDRLWILDEGILERFGNKTKFRNPTLFVYDLHTNRFLRFYQYTDDDTPHETFIVDLVVDVTKDNCDNAYAYVSDPMTSSLLVYSWAQHKSWCLKHSFFHFDPLQTNYYVGGHNFQWRDGLFGLSLSKTNKDGFRTLFFQPISGANTFSVSTQVLQNKHLIDHPDFYYFFSVEGRKGNHTQGSSMILDEETGVVFQTQINKNGIGCWNTFKLLNEDNFELFLENHEVLVYPNDLKIDNSTRKLYILVNKLPILFFGKFNTSDVNFRILGVNIDEAIANTKCSPKTVKKL